MNLLNNTVGQKQNVKQNLLNRVSSQPAHATWLRNLLLLTVLTFGGCTPMNTQAEPSKQPIYDEPYYWP